MSPSEPPRRAGGCWAAAALLVVALVAALYAPLWLGRASWPATQFTERVAPAQVAASRALRQGTAPWWWDEPGFGEPLAPRAAHAAFSPATALATSEVAASRVALAHLVVLLLALLAHARRLALPPALATASAVVLVAVAARWPEQLAAAAWGAVALLALRAATAPSAAPASARGQRVGAWALAASLAMVVVSGGLLLAGLIAALAAALLRGAPAPTRWRLALAVAGAAGASAVQWLPAALAGGPVSEWLAGGVVLALAAAVLALAWWGRALPTVAQLAALAVACVGAVALREALPGRERVAAPPVPPRAAAPVRVFCPTPVPAAQATAAQTSERALALDPGRALSTEAARAAGWRCVPGRRGATAQEQALWRRGAMAGGRLLRRWAVGHALVPRSTVVAAGFRELATLATWSLVAVPARPVAAVYHQWVAVPDAAAARRHLLEELQRGDWLLVESDGPSRLVVAPSGGPLDAPEATSADAHRHGDHGEAVAPPPLDGPVAEPCAIARWRPGDVALRCRAGAPALAAVALPYAPGWQVTVDEVPAPRLRAEVLLSAVALPAGEHQVRWRYRPRGAEVSAVLSVGTLLLAAAGFVVMLLGRRRARRETPA